jgi:hypothetical protein
MNKEELRYLKGLADDKLLDLLEDITRHDHYCPMNCRCFEKWQHRYFIGEVRVEIENRIK